MNLKFSLTNIRRSLMLMIVVVALSAAMLPTAAFASSYGHQGRAWNPGPPPNQQYHNNNNGQGQPPQGQPPQGQPPHSQPPQGQPPQGQCSTTYQVKPGDTLSGIAAHFGVSVNELAHENGIQNPNYIYAGQVLCIPC